MPPSRLGRFHHVGVAVREIKKAAESFSKAFGATPSSGILHDPNQGVRIQFMTIGDVQIELLEPAADPSPVDSILKRGVAVYHICHEVDDLDQELERMREEDGVTVISPPKPAVAFNHRRVAFVMCQGLIIELLESDEAGNGTESDV